MPDASQYDLFHPAPAEREPVPSAPVPAEIAALAARLPARLRLGTSSWAFPGWAGLVYAERVTEQLLAREGLAAYARHPLLQTVGLDRTYYAPLATEEFARYAAATPEHFRFVVKAHAAITTPLEQLSRRSPVLPGPERFLDPEYTRERVIVPMTAGLGARVGLLLFQFPPLGPPEVRDAKSFTQRLAAFLEALPRGPQYAVEVRNREFLTSAYVDALAANGVTHCFNVHPRMPLVTEQAATLGEAAWLSGTVAVRWMLHPGQEYEAARDRYFPFDRLVDPDPRNRSAVADLLETVLERGNEALVLANNKSEGSAPLTLIALARELDRRGKITEPRGGAS
jgi:uncharacterized protein YecE (DUF72 family)